MNSARSLGIAAVGLRPASAMPRDRRLHNQPAEAPLIETETVSRSSRPPLSLAKAAASDGVTVNAVSPGTILTPKLEAAFRKMADANGWADGKAAWPAVERAVLPHVVQVPLGKVGSTDDIAHAVVFLCSPLAGYITGVNLRVDGRVLPTL